MSDAEAADARRAIWAQHREGVAGRITVLERAVTALIEGSLDEDLRREAERAAHKLAGSLGTFGFMRGSERARELELAFEARGALGPGQVPTLSELVLQLEHDVRAEPAAAPEPPAGPGVLVVSRDTDLGDRLAAEAAGRGLRAARADSIATARAAVASFGPDAVLLDLDLPEGRVQVHELLAELTEAAPPVAVLALTATGSFTDRVEAARRGARAFLATTRPVAQIVDRAEHVLERLRADRPTVLAVDDDPALLAALGARLAVDGLDVVPLGDPLRLWEALADTRPDLLLLDLDMPDVNGIELCRVVRNDPRWATLPVVVLTSRADRDTVERVFAAGADDCAPKPVVGSELAVRIANRLERTRLLRELAHVDGLTGVATRAKAADDLARLARLADRFDEPLCLALLALDSQDVDDEVLRRLGRRLARTFRGEDVVGRWSTTEFVIGMYGMPREDGVGRVAEVVEAFRDERFADDARVTLSAGVAESPTDAPGLVALHLATDEALARARAAGGDRVVRAAVPEEAETDAVDVVLVEDDEPVAQLVLHALETRGYRARWVREGQVAAAALTGRHPALRPRLVLLDVDLPGLDGLAILRLLAMDGVLRRTGVIVLTARAAEDEVLKALELGASDHVAKPLSVPVLMQKVRRLLEG